MPTKTRLTDATLRRLRAPDSGQAEIWDKAIPGFGVRVTSKGARSFVLVYRHQGRSRRYTLGRYPDLKLKDARRMAQDARTAIAHGQDPAAQSANPGAGSFGEVLEQFFSNYCDRHNRASTAAETKRNMRATFLPVWRNRLLGGITRADVLAITDALIKREAPSAARHAFSNARKFFGWCVERGLLADTPCHGLKPPARASNRARTLTADELGKVLPVADAMGYPFGAIVLLLALTAQRRGEVAGMRWDELDTDEGIWTIPGTRSKNGRAHAVPLAPAALAIIENLPRLTGPFVFPARGNDEAAFSGWSKAKRALDDDSGVEGWTLHDLRRTAATGMARLGIAPHIVERVLNHAGGSFAGVAGVYNRFSYQDEMRRALHDWELCLARNSAIGKILNRAIEKATAAKAARALASA